MDSSCIDFVMFKSQGQDHESNMSRLPWKRMRDEDEELANCLVLLSKSGNAYKNERKAVKKPKTAHVFQCKGCKKVFASHQALGGHRASHKKVKGCFASQDKEEKEEEEDEYKEEDDDDEDEEEEEDKPHTITRKKSNAHECTICHRVFSSGQALGGHKRCHWLTPSTNYLRMTPLHESSAVRSQALDQPSLDLNLACVDPTVMSIGRDGGGNNHNATSSSSWLKLASGDWS